MQQQRRLGRGLESLLETNAPVSQANDDRQTVASLPIDRVFANPDQPRKEFDQAALQELAASIAEKGVIQPILVQERADGYMIIAGERRYRASKLAGKTEIPAIVRNYSAAETMEIALIENLQREDLNPMEEALAFRSLIDQFSLSQEEIAQKIGKNRSTVANSLRLLKLPEAIREGLSQNRISAGHARALLSAKISEGDQEALYRAIVDQGLSVREAEAITQSIAAGESFQSASRAVAAPPAQAAAAEPETPDIFALSQGATVKKPAGGDQKAPERRAPELWELEEKMIVALGTKVQIKGDVKSGKIEIAYFSLDDLERLFDLFSKK